VNKHGVSKDGEIKYSLYEPEEGDRGRIGIHVAGMWLEFQADNFEYLKLIAEALEHVEITDND
jgi:hypothetical protein